jgi:ribonuclease D
VCIEVSDDYNVPKRFVHLLHRCHARPVRAWSDIMSKNQRTNKEAKKQPLLTPKERKAAKRDKKHSGGHVPFIVKDS